MKNRLLVIFIITLIISSIIGCDKANIESKNYENSEITLYFGGNEGYLAGEIRDILNLTPQKAVEELILGPKESKNFGILPKQTEIIDVKVIDKIAYVNFNSSIEDNMIGVYDTSCGSSLLLYSIVDTLILHESFEIDKVQIIVEGEERRSLGSLAIEFPFEADMEIIKE